MPPAAPAPPCPRRFRRWLALACFCLTGCAALDPRQADPPPPGFARIETFTVDGLPERLLIRGRDPRNPLLLFVHGGPGFPGAVFQKVNADLERDFTVVHWDQRGAGYSYFRGIPAETMRVEQFVRETLLVARHLSEEFRQPKIYLLGHSWGTLPATLAAAREPARFQAYIGMCQMVDIDESERALTRRAIRAARRKGEAQPAAQLRAVGPPPYQSLPNQDRAAKLITAELPHAAHEITPFRLALLALQSRYYPLPELLRANAGYHFSRDLLDPQLHGYDLRRLAPKLAVPAYFFVGRGDTTFGVPVQRDYYGKLSAPRGKHFVLFNDSTHWPHLEQPAAFYAEMRRVKAETWREKP